MACYAPLKACQADDGTIIIGYHDPTGTEGNNLQLPCGKCEGCLEDKGREWATRCANEAAMHEHNCVLTLTYEDKNLPENGSLAHEDFQKFLKRLRQDIVRAQRPQSGLQADKLPLLVGGKLKYFMCGEYGEQKKRPHYHAMLFGVDFADKEKWSKTTKGNQLWRSDYLDKKWRYGQALIGEMNWGSAAYITQYTLKKMSKQQATEIGINPEYHQMSRRPGIGNTWIKKYHEDVYPHGAVILETGTKTKPPRYYDNFYKEMEDNQYEQMKIERQQMAIKNENDNTPKRLADKRKVHQAKIQQWDRKLT
ncbi:MAG: replication initiator protein [Microvirus sp.]|nr:MAG: replication initiator protein [Microvirus sp.]